MEAGDGLIQSAPVPWLVAMIKALESTTVFAPAAKCRVRSIFTSAPVALLLLEEGGKGDGLVVEVPYGTGRLVLVLTGCWAYPRLPFEITAHPDSQARLDALAPIDDYSGVPWWDCTDPEALVNRLVWYLDQIKVRVLAKVSASSLCPTNLFQGWNLEDVSSELFVSTDVVEEDGRLELVRAFRLCREDVDVSLVWTLGPNRLAYCQSPALHVKASPRSREMMGGTERIMAKLKMAECESWADYGRRVEAFLVEARGDSGPSETKNLIATFRAMGGAGLDFTFLDNTPTTVSMSVRYTSPQVAEEELYVLHIRLPPNGNEVHNLEYRLSSLKPGSGERIRTYPVQADLYAQFKIKRDYQPPGSLLNMRPDDGRLKAFRNQVFVAIDRLRTSPFNSG